MSFAAGLEEAAKYHDRKVEKWHREADRHERQGLVGKMELDEGRARLHERYAKDIRALRNPAERAQGGNS